MKKPRRKTAPEIFTPAEMRAWIANIRPKFLPWLLVCGFSTIRSEEVAPDPSSNKDPLRWEDFLWAKRLIRVRQESSKVDEQRFVPIPDNLFEWLRPWHDATGRVCDAEQPSKYETGRLGKISGAEIDGRWVKLKWKQNALRRTSISARLAIVKKRGQVAEEAGTSEQKIKEHYLHVMEEEQAQAWYAISPDRAQNILPLWQQRAG
jgi:hypothetical protein